MSLHRVDLIQTRWRQQCWVLLCTLSACSGDVDPLAIRGGGGVATGIIVRDESGQVLGTWGQPPPPGDLEISVYPNPFETGAAIVFQVDREQRGRVDVHRLQSSGEGAASNTTWIGSTIAFEPGNQVSTLATTTFAEGINSVVLRAEEHFGNLAVPLFLRVRVTLEDGSSGVDDVLYWPLDWSKLPPDLYQILFP